MMPIHYFLNNDCLLSGMTLKDNKELEANNMALHTTTKKEHVLVNRKKLAQSIGVTLNDFVCANQTHSANFYKVTEQDRGKGACTETTAIPQTDALYTFESNIVLCCFTADCVPLLFYNHVAGVIGVIHSGWQGTVKEITSKLFRHLIEKEQCNPKDFHVQIGAALCQEKFEVDTDVYEQFVALGYASDFMTYNEKTNKFHIDNQRTVQKQCEMAGILPENISIDQTCTFLNDAGFSYREHKQAGRHLSFIMKKGRIKNDEKERD